MLENCTQASQHQLSLVRPKPFALLLEGVDGGSDGKAGIWVPALSLLPAEGALASVHLT
jgi:hypothetical protein